MLFLSSHLVDVKESESWEIKIIRYLFSRLKVVECKHHRKLKCRKYLTSESYLRLCFTAWLFDCRIYSFICCTEGVNSSCKPFSMNGNSMGSRLRGLPNCIFYLLLSTTMLTEAAIIQPRQLSPFFQINMTIMIINKTSLGTIVFSLNTYC